MNEQPAGLPEDPETKEAIRDAMIPIPAWDINRPWLYRLPGRKTRSGYTKNKGKGLGKVRRRMAKASRRQNRK